jgi:predicted NAD/FAD-binding protein
MTATIVTRRGDIAEELHAGDGVSGYIHGGNPGLARVASIFRSLSLPDLRAAIPKPFSSSSLPPSLASGRSTAAFTSRARVDDAGPSFSPAAAHAAPVMGLLRGRGHPRTPGTQTHRRVAVVGAGIAGLSAAWALSDRAHVTLFEAADYPGGHTHTVDVTLDGPGGPVTHGVDTGFLVFNERTYPLLIQLFDQLGVATAHSDMSFSAQVPADGIEWSGSSLNTVFAQRRNLLRPAFWGMLADLLRFNRLCTALAASGSEAQLAQPIGDFLDQHRFGRPFRDWYLLPMVACIWSCPTTQMLQFPIRTLIRFCHNHGLLQVNDRPQWWTVNGGARHYVEAMLPAIHEVRLNSPVQAVYRPPGAADVVLQSARGREHFDAVVLAGHSDQSLALLAEPSDAEHRVLAAVRYHANRAVLHTDTRLLPRRRAAWAAWNYERGSAGNDANAVCLHYLLNQLQPLPWEQPVVVSLNPLRQPDPAQVIGSYDYAHPVFDEAAVRAQAQLPALQGGGGVWFAGAWTRYGFHEDGLLSGLTAAQGVIDKVLA